ncbi:MAG: O-methyltransferase [Propionibacteriaceae bacterium]
MSSSAIPTIVERALRVSLELGYVHTTRTETGRLLAALAATCTGTIAECGTGAGVGAAWLRSGAPKDVRVITAELDPALAGEAAKAIAGAGVEVVATEFRALAGQGPFDLILANKTQAFDPSDRDIAAQLLRPGGMLVIDDLEPATRFPPLLSNGSIDTARYGWLTDERFVTAEVCVTADSAVLLCTRR